MSETECTCEESVGECDWCLWRAKQAEYWAKYFGLHPGMTPQERVNQLEQFRPLNHASEEES